MSILFTVQRTYSHKLFGSLLLHAFPHLLCSIFDTHSRSTCYNLLVEPSCVSDWPCGIDWTAGRLMFVHFIIELENYEIIRINAYHDLKFTLPVSTGSKPQSDSA